MSAMTIETSTKTILIVECGKEDSNDARFLEMLQTQIPYRMLRVSSPEQACMMSQQEKPDLLLFVRYPTKPSCMHLYDSIRSLDQLEDIPALFLTSDVSEQEMRQRNILCLHRPFSLNCFLQTLDTLMAFPKSTIGVA